MPHLSVLKISSDLEPCSTDMGHLYLLWSPKRVLLLVLLRMRYITRWRWKSLSEYAVRKLFHNPSINSHAECPGMNLCAGASAEV